MKKYLVVYYAPPEAMAKMATATDEEKAAGMKAWEEWLGAQGDGVVDFGAPIMMGQGTGDGENWSNSNKNVSGYGLVQAGSMDDAKAMFENHPHIGWHPEATIGVYECMDMSK